MIDFFWFLNCAMQVFAAVMAIKLTRLTKMNLSWIIICVGLVVMSSRSIIQIVNVFVPGFGFDTHEPYTIGNLVVSFCFAVGVFMIKKMFVVLNEAETRQREYDKMLLNTAIMTEENERRRFATELHDGLGPLLSSIKMGFSAVADDISDVAVRQNLELAINEAITTVREVSNNMSPHILTNLGLHRAIVNFIGKIAFPKDMSVSYNISIGDKRYPATNEIVLYRVFCELVNNTLKHSGATAINFRIDEEGDLLRLTYKDNGTGFDPHRIAEQRQGMGLYNIVSRVTSIKGSYAFRTGGEDEDPTGATSGQHGMVAEICVPTKDR